MESGKNAGQAGIRKTFRRKETKYVLDRDTLERLMEKLGGRVKEDAYGRTSILSVYYDSDSFELLARSSDKPAYKEKLRVRSYGVPEEDSLIFAEIKKKYEGIVYKRRTAGTPEQIGRLLEEGILTGKDVQTEKEILWMRRRLDLKPALFIGYDRTAYVCEGDPDLRITADASIRYRLDDLDLRMGDAGFLLRGPEFRLLEIKSSRNLPLWLAEALSQFNIRAGSFSKAGTCYKEIIMPEKLRGGAGGKKVRYA